LTGESVTGEPKNVWRAHVAHVEFRNRIAHGAAWGDSQRRSERPRIVGAAGAFIARLDDTMARVDARDDDAE
jgi:hypothetical protein